MKICTKCKVEKELSEFNVSLDRKDGYYNRCRLCVNITNYERKNKVYAGVITEPLVSFEGEEWKTVENYPDYMISNFGRVYSYRKSRGYNGKFLKQNNCGGYLNVGLYGDNNKMNTVLVHLLVANSFVPKIEGKELVNHIDGDKSNAHYLNLEWVDNRENLSHAFLTKNVASKYTGVHLRKDLNKWIAAIRINKKLKHLGVFLNEEDAAQAYKDALIEYGLTNKYA